MALKQTNTLPLNLVQPPLPHLPKELKRLHDYLKAQQTKLQSMYNDVVQAQASQSLVGLAADLPEPGTPGRRFTATDTKIVYFDTGSAWLQAPLT